MALSKTYQQGLASSTNAAGATTNGTGFVMNYGASGVGKITNGGTGPTIAADFVIQVSNDNSTWYEWSRQTAGTTAGTVYLFPFALGIGNGGDWGYWRCSIQSNTAQSVTAQCDAETTVSL